MKNKLIMIVASVFIFTLMLTASVFATVDPDIYGENIIGSVRINLENLDNPEFEVLGSLPNGLDFNVLQNNITSLANNIKYDTNTQNNSILNPRQMGCGASGWIIAMGPSYLRTYSEWYSGVNRPIPPSQYTFSTSFNNGGRTHFGRGTLPITDVWENFEDWGNNGTWVRTYTSYAGWIFCVAC